MSINLQGEQAVTAGASSQSTSHGSGKALDSSDFDRNSRPPSRQKSTTTSDSKGSEPRQFLSASELFGGLNQKYEDAYRGDTGLTSMLSELMRLLPPAARVLDVGCGTGKPVAHNLSIKGFRVHGIDVTPEMLTLARRNAPQAEFELVDMAKFQPQQPYDAVSTVFSLFQMSYPQLLANIQHFADWLVPGGILFLVTVPGETWLRGANAFDADWGFADDLDLEFMGAWCKGVLVNTDGWHKVIKRAGLDIFAHQVIRFQADYEGAEEVPHLYIMAHKPDSSNST